MKKFIVAIAALAMMTGSAIAADWNFYGSARVSTFWSDTDVIDGANGDTQVAQALQGNARIGAKVAVSDELAGRFEYGASGGVANIRLLYGEWNFGAGKLLVGQDYVPVYMPGSNQVYATDNGLAGWGEMYGGRKAQLKLTFGGFQIAAVAPNRDFDGAAAATDMTLPQIQAQYKFAGEGFAVLATAGYQTFDIAGSGADITSYVLGIDGSLSMGGFTLGAQIHGGENVGNLMVVDTGADEGLAVVAGGVVTDNEALGGRIYLGYAINDMFGLEVGYGYQETELDVPGAVENEVQSYYIQAPITLAPGVFVVPEFGMIDYKETGEDEITYFGAKWQINF